MKRKYLILTKEESRYLSAHNGDMVITRAGLSIMIKNNEVVNESESVNYRVVDPLETRNTIVLTHQESKELKINGFVNVEKWGRSFRIVKDPLNGLIATELNPYYGALIITADEK